MRPNTLYEQREIILEILRTRSMGGASGIGGGDGTKPGSRSPVPGDREREIFGDSVEGWSRAQVERAIRELNEVDPAAHAAINEIFNEDTGGNADWEHYRSKPYRRPYARLRLAALALAYPKGRGVPLALAALREFLAADLAPEGVVSHATRGIWMLLAKLPPSRYPLEVKFGRGLTPEEQRRQGLHHGALYSAYKGRAGSGERKAIVDTAAEYNLSESRTRQIIQQEREREGLPKRKPGRPKKMEVKA